MGRDAIQLEDAVSTISEEYLLEFTLEYGIPESLHLELPGPEETIVDFPEGWMSFSKRPRKNTPQCYTKPFDSLKNWNNRFFWVDERIFPTVVACRASAPKDKMPSADSYFAADVTILDTYRTPFHKQPELLLCLVGLKMDLFNLISAPNPARVKTGTRPRAAHEVPLLTVTVSHIIEMEDTTVASGSSETPSTLETIIDLHLEFPGPEETIVDFLEGKVGVYTKFFEFSNYRIPISQFLFDILGYYQIHLSQLSVIGAAKVSHFEINCHVLNINPTLNLFCVFYVSSYTSGWMSFRKRPGKNTPQCYTKPLDSLKNWNNQFFWVDERIFPTVVACRASAPKDKMPSADSYSATDVTILDTHRTPFHKQPELLLYLVGMSQSYFLGDDVYPTFSYDDDREMDLFNLISAPNPARVKTGTRPRAAHEVPLLTVTASHVIEMEDTTVASGSSETPSTLEKSPLDFANENPSQLITEGDGTEDQVQGELSCGIPPEENPTTTEVVLELEKEVVAMGPCVNKRHRKRGSDEADANAPPKVLRKDHATVRPEQSAKSVFQDPLQQKPSYGVQDQFLCGTGSLGVREIKPSHGPGDRCQEKLSINQGGVDHQQHRIPSCRQSMASPGYFSELRHLPNADFLSQYNINLARQVAMGSQLRLRFEQEVRLLKKAKAKIARRDHRIQVREEEIKRLDHEVKSLRTVEVEVHGLRNRTKNLETLLEAEVDMKKTAEAKNAKLAQVTGEERIKAAFKEFKKYEDDKVEQRCAKMDARLDALRIDFDVELYPHMLTVIAGRRWVIGYGLRLAMMKCGESMKLSDTGEDAPQWIRKLHSSSSQLKIPVYPEVCDAKDPWAFKEEILLEDAIAANISHAKKKKRCRVVYHTHGVGSAHHARSDGVSVSVPTVAPQGIAILLADAATQTEIYEDEASSRLPRSKSLPPMYNLDWP
ncbi:hypothetical protein Tco_0720743 [Tanacetum coccineum]